MKPVRLLTLTVFTAVSLATASAAVLLDDTWADGTRTNQNLPTDSAWFTTSAANVGVSTGQLSFTNLPSSSSQWATYFTSAGTPVRLGVGDSLTLTLSFTLNGVGGANNNRNFRVGVFDSSAGTRLATDSTPNGLNYSGYALFLNMAPAWGGNTGIEHRARTNLANSDLLATAVDFIALGNGGTTTATPAFSHAVPYSLTLTYTRTDAATMSLMATVAGEGLTNSHTRTDSTLV